MIRSKVLRKIRYDLLVVNAQTTRGSEQEAQFLQFSTSGTSRQWLPAQRQRQQSLTVQHDQQTDWRPLNEWYEVQYSEFAGPEHGPTFDFLS